MAGRHKIFLTDSRLCQDGNIVICGQYSKDEDLINRLMENIKSRSHSFQPVRSVDVGEMCLALFAEDGLWYRGLVAEGSGSLYSIEFIDYGNIQPTKIQDLRDIPDDFRNLEPQAHCFLFEPQGGPVNPAGVWTPDITEAINDEFLYAEAVVEISKTTAGSLVVKSDSISQILVDKKLIDINKPYRVFVDPKTRNEASMRHEKYIVGQKINAVLSWVEPDGSFYCYNSANEHLLNAQLDTLYEACEGNKLQPLHDSSIGTLCCAPFSVDGNWYRAKMISKSADEALVRFIDYGNTDTSNVSSLLTLGEDFRTMPVQAIHCSLSGNLEIKELIKILSFLKEKEVMMEFVNLEVRPCAVRLYYEGNVVGLTRGSTPSPAEMQSSGSRDLTQVTNMPSYKHVSITLGSTKQVILKETSDVKSMCCVLAENLEDLRNLCEETNEMYNRISDSNYDLEPDQSDLNRPCVTFDHRDKRWYRSKLLSPAGPNEYKVLYVDLGRIQVVHSKSIRIISEDLLNLPAFAIRFTLTAVLSASGDSLPLEQCLPTLPCLKEKAFVAVFNTYDQDKDLYFAELHDVGRHFRMTPSPVKSAIPKPKVPLNVELPIRITSVEDPDCVWVQLFDYQADLIVLTGKLNGYYNNLPQHALALTDIHRGQVCCMKSSRTKNWCRGEIAYFYDDIIEVKYIDFGYIEATNMSDAKVLMPEFMSLPSQAICCRLHNLKPAASRWCNGSTRYLKEFVLKTGVMARFVDKKGDLYSAEMHVTANEEKIHLSEKLVLEDLAAWIDSRLVPESHSEEGRDVPEASPIVPKISPSRPRVFYSHPGIGLIGAEVPAIVCDSPSPSDFFILPRNSGLQLTYDKLSRELKMYLGAEPAKFAEVYVGMPCICIVGRECYRAAIVSEEKSQNPLVFLVDFGEKKRVNLSDMRNITTDHITCVPPIAIRCTMHGVVEPKNQFWSSIAMVKFTKFCKETTKDLICTIYGCVSDGVSQFFMAKLNTPFLDIAQDLVDSANCRFVEPMGKMSPPFCLKSYVYSNLGTGIGKEDFFYITHVERADLFYCQLASKFHIVDDFMDKVQEYCSKYVTKKLPSVKELAFLPPCFAKYDDGKWYRAHYSSPQPQSPNLVSVLFIDYGNLVTLPIANIIPFEYKSGLAEVPIQAVPCSLSEIVVPIQDMTESERMLSKMKTQILHHQLPGIVTGSTNGKFHLDLFVDQQRVNDQIIGNVSPVSLTSPNRVSIKADHDPLLKGKFKEIENIGPKTVLSVYISEITDPDHFHVRLESLEDEFNECTAEVDGFYTAVRRQDYVVTSLQNGDVICAKHPATLRWCRALVVDAESHKPTHVLVEFVDFGDQEYVSIADDTKKLMKSMLQWPRMTISCQMANVLPVGKAWESKSVEFFINTCRAIHCRVRFNTFDVTQRIWSIDMKIKGKNVAHMLVENNHGTFINVPSSTASSNAELVKTKPIESWKLGVTKQVYISHVESENEVYLQLVESQVSLDAMMAKLNDPSVNLKAAVRANLQQSYVSRYDEDGRYYRGNIITSDADTHHIIYTDYGNASFVKIAGLRLLPKEFSTLPEQAIKCRILYPSGLDKDLIVAKLEDLAVDESVALYSKCMKVNGATLDMDLTISGTDGNKTSFASLFESKGDGVNSENKEKLDIPAKISFKNLDLKTGVDTKVYVSQVDGPEKIWIQLSAYSKDLDNMMGEIDVFCNSDAVQKLKIFDVGTPCLAKYYDDNGWYRGEIKEMKTSQDKAVIHFVDYGNSDTVKIDDIKTTSDKFLELPKQAVLCKLRNMKGIAEWKTSDTDNFVERVSDVELTAQFYPCRSTDELYDVKLIYPCGKSLNDEWNETLNNRSPATTAHDGRGDIKPINQSAASSLLADQHIVTDRGDHVIVENLAPVTKLASLNFSASMEVRPDSTSTTVLEELTVESGMEEDGYVSHCENPGHFFIQLGKYAPQLDQIYELAARCAGNAPEEPVEPGKYYVTQSPGDGECYRAKCTEISNEKCTVFFLDYGNIAQVEEKDMKQMSDELKRLPIQAIECQIHNLRPASGSWGEVTDSFLDLTIDKDLKIDFVQLAESGRWNVKLLFENTIINDQILEKHKNILCHGQEVSEPGPVPPTFVHAGNILCVKVVKIIHSSFTGVLLNFPIGLLQDAISDYVQSLEEDLEKYLLSASDLLVDTVYLSRLTDWHCIKVTDPGANECNAIDLSTKETMKFEQEDFLRPTSYITTLAERMLAECILEESTNAGLENSTILNEVIATEFLSQNQQGQWIVKITPIGQIIAEKTCVPNEAQRSAIPEVIITDLDKTDDEISLKQWISENLSDLGVFFSKGTQLLLENCPESILSLRNALLESEKLILSNLTEQEKKAFESDSEDTSPSERLKRMSSDWAGGQNGKELPAKKMKLDVFESLKSERQPLDGMFDVGDVFEAIISKIDHPGCFFIRPFLVMSEPATVAAAQCKDVKKRSKKILQYGLCIAKITNLPSRVHHWVRAIVEDFEDDRFLLTDVDTGIEFVAKAENIYPVGEDMKSWPSFCMECSLAGIKPHATGGSPEKWSESAINELRSLLGSANISDRVEVSVVSINKNEDTGREKYSVNLNINEMSVAATLISLHVAEPDVPNAEKENVAEISHVVITDMHRGTVRKPLADLMPEMHRRQPSTMITPRTSESVGQSFPDFDLLAVPWKIIRTSIEGSQTESLSDSVFVSDAEESFAVQSSQLAFPVKRQLASFKIYCSTKSSVYSLADDTLSAEAIQESLPKEEIAVKTENVHDKDPLSSISSSLLGLLTPVTTGSEDTDHVLVPLPSDCIREQQLDEASIKLVADVFNIIEKEEEDERNACTIPDSLNDATGVSQDVVCTETNTNQDEAPQGLEDDECTIPDSLVVADQTDLDTNQQDIPERSDDAGCTIPDSLCTIPAPDDLGVSYPPSRLIEHAIVEDSIQDLVIDISESLNHLKDMQSEITEPVENIAPNDGTKFQEPDVGDAAVIETEKIDLCDIPHPDDVELYLTPCLEIESAEIQKPPRDEQENDLLEIPHPLNQENDYQESEIFNQEEKEIQEEIGNKEELEEDLCEIPDPAGFPFVVEITTTEDEDQSTLDADDVAENLSDLPTSARLDRSVEDIDYYSAEESLVDIPASKNEDVVENTVFPAITVSGSGERESGSPDEYEPECNQHKTSPLISMDPYKRDSPKKQDVSKDTPTEDGEQKPLERLQEINVDDGKDSPPIHDDSQANKEENSPKTPDSGVCGGADIMDEEDDIVDRLRNMSIEDDPPEQKEEVITHESSDEKEDQIVFKDQEEQVHDSFEKNDNEQVTAEEEPRCSDGEVKDSAESCSVPHQHQRFYICCLPKMELEVGDTYQVMYMTSKDPHNIQLQFNFGTDTEEWRNAMCNINTREAAENFDTNDVWEPDMMCLVQSLTDLSWERGRIVTLDDDSCQIELIDYGETMKASKTQLREIPENLCLYPRQSTRCSIANVTMIKEQWNENIKERLTDILFCSSLKAEIVEMCESPTEESYGVNLFLIQDNGEVDDITQMLVDVGLVQIRKHREEETKTDDEEWSTMADSTWETLLHADSSRSDLLHSSNVDISNIEEVFKGEDLTDAEIRESGRISKRESLNPTEEELNIAADNLQKNVIESALIITKFGNEDSLGRKSPPKIRRRKSKDIYIDVEKIPGILVTAFESTEID